MLILFIFRHFNDAVQNLRRPKPFNNRAFIILLNVSNHFRLCVKRAV